MAERSAVNRMVVGSSPTRRAMVWKCTICEQPIKDCECHKGFVCQNACNCDREECLRRNGKVAEWLRAGLQNL